jgi:hypothetical protein
LKVAHVVRVPSLLRELVAALAHEAEQIDPRAWGDQLSLPALIEERQNPSGVGVVAKTEARRLDAADARAVICRD